MTESKNPVFEATGISILLAVVFINEVRSAKLLTEICIFTVLTFMNIMVRSAIGYMKVCVKMILK